MEGEIMSIEDFINNVKTNPLQSALSSLHDIEKEDQQLFETLREKIEYNTEDMEKINALLGKYKEQIPNDLYEAVMQYSETNRPADIIAPIDPEEGIYAKIWNGEFGKIAYATQRKEEIIIRWNGYILGVVLVDERSEAYAIKYRYNDREKTVPANIFLSFAKQRFFLSTGDAKKLREIIDAYMMNEIKEGRFTEGGYSLIYVSDDKIVVDYPDVPIADVLKLLRDYHDKSTKPEAYRSMLSFCLLAPLHYYIKKKTSKGIQTPLMLLSGKTGSGKTPMTYIFVGKGYGMQKEEYVFGLNMIDKIFTFTSFLAQTNIPIVLDDIGMGWVVKYHEHIKSYMQSSYFGARGNADQTVNIYKGVASFIMTMNDDYVGDSDPAFTKRLIYIPYTEKDSEKVDKAAYLKFMETLPDGFMYMLTRKILHGIDIQELMNTVENFSTADDWVNYGIDLINNECFLNGVDVFPKFRSGEASATSYTRDIVESMINEWERKNTMTFPGGSFAYGNIEVEDDKDRIHIYFTSLGLKKVLNNFGNNAMPYQTATEFLNAIMKTQTDLRVEKNSKGELLTTKRISGKMYPIKAYHISKKKDVEL